MFAYDYGNEELVRVNNIIYSIYRTYIADHDEIELYLERRHGND
jgi:hypothetical protein